MACEKNDVPVMQFIRHSRFSIRVSDPEQNNRGTILIVATTPLCSGCEGRRGAGFILGGDNRWHCLSEKVLEESFGDVVRAKFLEADWISNARF